MPKVFDDWRVLPHGPIEKLSENLWRVEGTIPRMSLRRVMTIARKGDGQLVIHNGIALQESAQKEIEAWGIPAFLIVPNGYHRLDALAYKKRYPALCVLAPKGSLAKVRQAVSVDGTYEDFHQDETVCFESLRGINDAEGAMWVRSADGMTLVLNDIVFNMDKKHDFLGFLFTTLLGSAPGPRVSRLAKLALVKDKKALREDLERLANTRDLVRLIVSHEKVAMGPQAANALRKAATFL